MEKVNFEPIGKVMEAFDTDTIDIGRRMEIINPDGTIGETMPNVPLYSNIPCHLSFQQIANPNPNTSETRPITQLLKISCSLEVDLQNGDYIIAKKRDIDGNILEQYSGTIGAPTTSMSRKTAEMEIRKNI